MPPTEEKIKGAIAVVITHDGRILLQDRDDVDAICCFGGGAEPGETPLETLKRELQEELGAVVRDEDAIFLCEMDGNNVRTGAPFTEQIFVWRDTQNSITGIYEGRPLYCATVAEALANPKLAENVRPALVLAVAEKLL